MKIFALLVLALCCCGCIRGGFGMHEGSDAAVDGPRAGDARALMGETATTDSAPASDTAAGTGDAAAGDATTGDAAATDGIPSNGEGDGAWSDTGGAAITSCDVMFSPADHFTVGTSLDGQNGWLVDTGAGFDERVEQVGAAAHGGQGVWRVSNRVSNGAFGNMPRGPELPESAGESSVRTAGGGDSMEYVLWVRSVSEAADGSFLAIHMSPPAGDRLTYVRIVNGRDQEDGLHLVMIDYYGGGSDRQITIASQLPRASWLKLRMVMRTLDGPNNDIFDVWLDGTPLGSYSTWEGWFYANPPLPAVDRVMFRLSVAPNAVHTTFADENVQGFFVDDLCYRIYSSASPQSTIAHYRTGFEP